MDSSQPQRLLCCSYTEERRIVGHISSEISRIVWYFIEHDGTVSCEVTGPRKRGVGLVVQCRYTFCAKKKLISKLQKKLDKRWYVQKPNTLQAN